jgi:hypothetical protein
MPKGSNCGFLITQRLGLYGIHGVLTEHFKKFFQDRFSEFIVDFKQYLSKDFAKKLIEKGGIKKIILKRHTLPADIADRLGISLDNTDIEVEFRITAKSHGVLPMKDKAKRFINHDDSKLFDVQELTNLGFDGKHDSYASIKLGRSERIIDLSEVGQIKPLFDVDEQIERQPSGHPVFKSIDKVARRLVADIKEEVFEIQT